MGRVRDKLTRAELIIDFQFPTVIAQLVPNDSSVRSANPTRRMDYRDDDNRFFFFLSFKLFG